MPTFVTPKKNTQYIFYISLVSQANTKVFQANPTLAAGDFQVATDDAAPANLGTLPVVDADFTKRVKVTLSAAEMNGDNVTVIAADVAGAEWCDLTINIQTSARQLDDLAWPTTTGRSIDVTATGGVGIDWANVEAQATAVTLSATTVGTATAVTTVNGLAAGTITAAAIATGAIDADSLAADAGTEIAAAVWDRDATLSQTQGTFGQAVGDPVLDTSTIWGLANTNLDAAVSSRMATYTQPTGFLAATFPAGTVASTTNITAGTITTATNLTTNNDKTGYSIGTGGIVAGSFAAGAIDAAAIAANAVGASEFGQDAAQEIADEILNRNIAGGGSGGTRIVRDALRLLRNKVSIAAGTLTVTQEDDTTTAWIAAVTTAAGNPLSSIDPA